jgi:hypothetical protein
MRFFTATECQSRFKKEVSEEAMPPIHTLHCAIPFDRLIWFSRYLVGFCETFDELLLQPVAWDIFDENLHLYYKVRQAYGDARLLDEAPGHLFLKYEFEDAATFVQLCLMSLWDVNLTTNLDYANVSLSHDGFVAFRSENKNLIDAAREELLAAKVRVFGPPVVEG